MFILHCTDTAGVPVSLRYAPHSSALTNLDGTPVLANRQVAEQRAWEDAVRINPEQPGLKVANPSVLKIQLGLGCNYTCSYCNQASQVESMAMTKTADALAFLHDLEKWLEGVPSRIELWGGEPLLYFRKLQVLVPELDRKFPDAEISMVTNGSLLTQEILDFIAFYDIQITVSHDGPGQYLRGEDPFENPARAAFLTALWKERKAKGRMIFSSVLTPGNSDPAAIRQWFVNRLADDSVITSLEGIVATHDDNALAGPGVWSPAQYQEMRASVARSFETGEALRIPALAEKAKSFFQAVMLGMPSTSMGQKCGMDRSDHVAVDLHSNVLTCQNTGANAEHGLGSALEMDAIRMTTSTHWAYRECCNHCPVLQLCGGSCMYLEGEQFAQSCENEYQFGMGVLDGTLRRALGLKLESIEGDIRRPIRRKTIPIIARQ
ncbi:radical SAM protein [Variovorax sp. AFSI2.2]|uniref:radical SAM protein n=1 Tax=Variovorax sp. AFSI2.2 TaxID=3384160 RepID=UPI003EB88661